MDLDNIIEKNKEELLENLERLVSYENVSVETEGAEPFGRANAECLNEALRIAEKYGFRTKNLDNYCGYAEIGNGDKVIGIAAHLDIVPAGDGWETNPFCLTIKDGKIYGRGTSDDKGAVVASMLALKIIKESNIPLNKRIRLIMGCAEETGSKCMQYYTEKEGDFEVGFTPDGDFPCVYGEKGHIRAIFRTKNTSIIDIKGGTVANAVCDNCVISIKKGTYNKESLEQYFLDNNIEIEVKENEGIDTIKAKGITAHASTPKLGKNAIMYLLKGLKQAGYEDEFVNYYCDTFNLENDGKGLGVKCADEYGELTCVNGTISMKNGEIIGSIDVRVPITLNSEDIVNKLNSIKDKRASIEIVKFSDTTYFPTDSDIVQKLLKVYQEVTGDMENLPSTTGRRNIFKSFKKLYCIWL